MSTKAYGSFLESIPGKTLGIVYSSRFEGAPSGTWYHRWRSDIIGLYSSAAEALGMEQCFFNVDQFMDAAGQDKSKLPDYVLNLNSGNRFLGNLALVPSICEWLAIPVAFCDVRTAIVSEDKRLSKILADRVGFRVPREDNDGIDRIVKPFNLGSSVGVKRISNGEKVPTGFISEEFINGVDATIVLFLDKNAANLIVGGAQIVLPDVSNPREWIYSEEAKENSDQAPKIEYRKVSVSKKLQEISLELARSCGSRVSSSYWLVLLFSYRSAKIEPMLAMPLLARIGGGLIGLGLVMKDRFGVWSAAVFV